MCVCIFIRGVCVCVCIFIRGVCVCVCIFIRGVFVRACMYEHACACIFVLCVYVYLRVCAHAQIPVGTCGCMHIQGALFSLGEWADQHDVQICSNSIGTLTCVSCLRDVCKRCK